MCTVTMAPVGVEGGFRVACNRDESFNRPAALGPRVRPFGGRPAVLPIDRTSAGTWIAVNDAGIAFALLNADDPPRQEGKRPRQASISRGRIIPRLLHRGTVRRVVEEVGSIVDPAEHAPFTLVVAGGSELAGIRSDGEILVASISELGAGPRLFTSSGLGDRLVEGPRARLFRAMFQVSRDWRRTQESYHRHSWPDRPHLSVCMRRPGAGTVSHTSIEVGAGAATLSYQPGPPDRPTVSFDVTLALRAAGADYHRPAGAAIERAAARVT